MKEFNKMISCAILCTVSSISALAQGNGSAALQQANREILSYIEPITSLFYVVCAIVGFIGAIKVYGKWSSGSPDTTRTAASWFGSCVFAVVAVTAIRAFFLE